MENKKINSFFVVGISIRTTNENNQSSNDIPLLWNKFMSEGLIQQIPNKIDNTIYCIYTDYESDFTKPYTTIIGCKVSNDENIPVGMIGTQINEGKYSINIAKGNIMQGMVYNEWIKIWNSKISRAYTTDFEVYGEKAQNPEDAEVEIFIAINK